MSRCAYPWQQMIIDLTGEVVPCCYWSGYGNFGKPLGNTNTSSLDEIWHGEAYVELREKVSSGDLDGHPCGNCLAYRSTSTFPGFSWPAGFTHESGHCYLGRIPESLGGDGDGPAGTIELLEDGKPLGSPDSLHDDIRKIGLGRYSIWNGWFYFSSSDNSDPTVSGRTYELVRGDQRYVIGGLVVDSASGRNLKTAYNEYMEGKGEVTAEPSMISLISTADCNIDCPGCSQNVVRVTRVQHRAETVPSILAKVPYLTQFIWHGGEPYLIKKFRSFIDGFKTEDNPNLTFGFTSNGTMITAEEARKLEKFPNVNASVSMDSFNRETFERIRAGAKFDRVWNNFSRLLSTYDAPRRVYSVGMVVCKSNMAELASNVKFAIENDIGLNLSPVVIYPVTEQINVFSDFSAETKGWFESISEAKRLIADAKRDHRPAIMRVDPEGMLDEIERLVRAAKAESFDVVNVIFRISDPHSSLQKMRRPAIIAHSGGSAFAYFKLTPGTTKGSLRLPRRPLSANKFVRLDLVHDVMEPDGYILKKHVQLVWRPFGMKFEIPNFREAPRPRNINWANYGDSTPDGNHIVDPAEIHHIYRKLYTDELTSR